MIDPIRCDCPVCSPLDEAETKRSIWPEVRDWCAAIVAMGLWLGVWNWVLG